MPDDPDATTTSPSDWKYVSEGGATIVFSYAGPPRSDFKRTVLRLRKSVTHPPPKPIHKPLDLAEEWGRKKEDELEEAWKAAAFKEDKEKEEEPDDPTIEFQKRVTSLLIPPKHLPRLEPVRVQREWLQELARLSEAQRPPERRAKDGIDPLKTKAVLATDLVGGKGMAVEIKPKWAFLPNPRHLSEETKDVKPKYCRFCMHSCQKVQKGQTAALGYCPLDLFSRDKTRIRKALTSLWDAWVESNGTVNNLKIFVDGKMVIPSDATAIAVSVGAKANATLPELRPLFVERLLPLLYDTVLLRTLATLQRTLDALDIEGLSALWTLNPSRDHQENIPVGWRSPEPTIEEWVSFTAEYLEGGREYDSFDLSKMEGGRLRYWMLAYLMSATFKDCSMILRLSGDEMDGKDTITAIDLDPKSVERLRQWGKQDREIVLAYKARGMTKQPCIDDGHSKPALHDNFTPELVLISLVFVTLFTVLIARPLSKR